ncbi:MAG: hypothetical protein ACYC2K_16575 [Gemmatimonadales bacterium]
MTIHKAKGMEFDEGIVFEGLFSRYIQRPGADGERFIRFKSPRRRHPRSAHGDYHDA